MWTLGRTLSWIESYLTDKQDEHPRQSAQYLMSEVLGVTRIELYTQLDRPLTEEERAPLRQAVARRGLGEPLQYITGRAPFRFLELKVAPGVLIPRPETEVLVSEGLTALKAMRAHALASFEQTEGFAADALKSACEANPEGIDEAAAETSQKRFEFKPLVLDICTGSGCIALSVAHECADSHVLASDISSTALSLAQENAEEQGLSERVSFYQGDLGAAFPKEILGKVDLILSNPPYIPSSVVQALSPEVKDYEPCLALDGGVDGLDLYRRLLPYIAQALCPGGFFGIELHEDCLDEALELAQGYNFVDLRVVRDLSDRPRFIVGTQPERKLA